MTLMTITPGPWMSPDRIRNGIGISGGATATRTVATENAPHAAINARPTPSRSPIVWAVAAPMIVPMPPIADGQADRLRRQSELADDEDEIHGETDLPGEVEDRDRGPP